MCLSSRGRREEVYAAILNLPGNSDASVFFCEDCDLLYLWPYVPEELIAELYNKSYFTGVSGGDDISNVPSSNINYENEFAAARLRKFRETLEMVLKHDPQARSILDIGAATGDFLAIARELGLKTTGVELSAYASARAKEKYGFVFYQTAITDYKGTETYDLIHMNHVFEHFQSPHQVLKRINSLLKVNGMVYVEVPFQFNVFEVAKYRLTGKRKVFDIFSLHHPIFYRPDTLKGVFAEHGFICRSLNVFTWTRYPAIGLSGYIKKLMWFAASLIGQGLVIEAVFEKRH